MEREQKQLENNTETKFNHLDVFSHVLDIVFAVFHGHLVVILTLRDVSHLSLGFVLQK